jgi:sigma-B regulation protein RsbU (phosphoserine phosphatase)
MLIGRRPWTEELDIIDRTMKAISSVSDPEELVEVYWNGIGELWPVNDYVSVSRRSEQPPFYRITRSSRFTEDINPWLYRDRLPLLSGGLLGEIVYANKPVIIDDLPSRLASDDPAHFYLEGMGALIALPQYDGGESLNVTGLLLPPGVQIDHAMVPIMHWQSGLFGRGTQNLVLKNQLGDALAKLDRELQVVGQIQRSLLPQKLPTIQGFDVAAYYLTSARAGGDYYDFFPLHGGAWGLFIADVSGHGTPAAVVMAITHALAHAQPGTHTPPPTLLGYLNDHLARSYTTDGTFVTAFYAILDPIKRTLSYSSAGHNPPRLVRGQEIISLAGNRALPLGVMEQETYCDGSTIALQRGDLLVLYTDGITEAMAPRRGAESRELFGVERLDKLLLTCTAKTPQETIDCVLAELARVSENAMANDDQTLIAIRCL